MPTAGRKPSQNEKGNGRGNEEVMQGEICRPKEARTRAHGVKFDELATTRRHARMILSDIHDFNNLETGFPAKTASGMTFCERIRFDARPHPTRGPSNNRRGISKHRVAHSRVLQAVFHRPDRQRTAGRVTEKKHHEKSPRWPNQGLLYSNKAYSPIILTSTRLRRRPSNSP